MKKIVILFPFIFLIAFFSFIDCEKVAKNSSSKTITILPLGDSRVEGTTTNSVSYRYGLWKQLVSNHWDFDYVGTQKDNTSYPLLLGKSFDPDHQGIGGYKTEDVLNTIEFTMAQVGIPDVVLLGIGGNDLLRDIPVSKSIDNINQTIDLLQNKNANITIFIERIAPGRSDEMTAKNTIVFNAFNTSIKTLAMEQSNDNSKIVVVDMSTNWKNDYMADTIHYNILGANEIAHRYFEAIVENIKK